MASVYTSRVLSVIYGPLWYLVCTIYGLLVFGQLNILAFPVPVVGIIMLLVIKGRLIVTILSPMVDNISIVNNFLRKIAATIV